MTSEDTTNHTITLPISEHIYDEFTNNNKLAHKMIGELYDNMPKLFPVDLSLGILSYSWHNGLGAKRFT